MSSNEPVEVKLAAIQAEVKNLNTAVGEIRQDVREVRGKMEAGFSELRSENRTLRDKIDEIQKYLLTRIDTKFDELRTEGAELRAEGATMRKKMDQMMESIADLKAMQKAILWILGGFGTILGVGLPAAKAFGWM